MPYKHNLIRLHLQWKIQLCTWYLECHGYDYCVLLNPHTDLVRIRRWKPQHHQDLSIAKSIKTFALLETKLRLKDLSLVSYEFSSWNSKSIAYIDINLDDIWHPGCRLTERLAVLLWLLECTRLCDTKDLNKVGLPWPWWRMGQSRRELW